MTQGLKTRAMGTIFSHKKSLSADGKAFFAKRKAKIKSYYFAVCILIVTQLSELLNGLIFHCLSMSEPWFLCLDQ
jgi:hypothetical protein